MKIETVIASCMKHKEVLGSLHEAITSDLVISNPFYRQVGNFLVEFYHEYKSLPKRGDYEVWLSDQPEASAKQLKQATLRLLKEQTEQYTPEYIATELTEALRELATKNVIARINASGNPDFETLQTLTDKVEKIRPVTLEGGARLRDVDRWINASRENRELIKSGILKLDKYVGGFGPELVFLVAPPGRGKSIVLNNFGHYAATFGNKVLHISFEMGLEAVMHRYYRRITQEPRNEFKRNIDGIKDQVMHWMKYTKGDIYTYYFDAYTKSPTDLRHFVEMFVQQNGAVNMILLDYLDLMKPSKEYSRLNLPEQLTRMSHEIRAIGLAHDSPMISATQPKIDAYDKESIGLSDLGSSRGKQEAAELILALNQTAEEESVDQARLGILKARENPGRNREIPLLLDKDRMFVGDLDDPQSQNLINPVSLLNN